MRIILGALIGGLIGWIIWRFFQSPPRNQLVVPDLDAPEAIQIQRKEVFSASGIAILFIGYVVSGLLAAGLWLYGAGSLFMQQRLIESAVALVLPPIGMGYGLFRLLGWW